MATTPEKHCAAQPANTPHLSQSTGLGALCGQHGMSATASTAASPDIAIAKS